MLVLTRKVDETIVINDNITVKIVAVRGNQAKIGIDAPPNIIIMREELYNKKN